MDEYIKIAKKKTAYLYTKYQFSNKRRNQKLGFEIWVGRRKHIPSNQTDFLFRPIENAILRVTKVS